MKPTKHIKQIAEHQTADEFKRYSWMNEANAEGYTQENAARLMRIRKALLNGRLYFRVSHVSRSGMSRTLEVAYIEDNQLLHIRDPYILRLMGCNKDGRINGCGMDMMFAAQYNLFQALCPTLRYQDKMPRYRQM